MQLNATQLEMLARLGRSPDGWQLQELIKAEVEEVNRSLRVLSGETLIRAQGRAQCLDELLERFNPKPRPTRDTSSPRHFQPARDVLA